MKTGVTLAQLRERLAYDPETGVFTWLKPPAHMTVGQRAGYLKPSNRYREINIARSHQYAHRLAWLYVYGVWPTKSIDHINGDRDDNRIANLREATTAQQIGNSKRHTKNTSGARGVYWHKKAGKWVAQITVNYQVKYLGLFTDKGDAAKAYAAAAREHFGEFIRGAA